VFATFSSFFGIEVCFGLMRRYFAPNTYRNPSQEKKSCCVKNSVINKATNPIMANLPFIFSAYWFQPKLGSASGLSSEAEFSDGASEDVGFEVILYRKTTRNEQIRK